MVFFGFTHCPNVCPTTLLDMSNHLAELGKDGDRIKMIFITVDPERDTSEHLKSFLDSFDRRIVGLTGDLVDVAAVAHAFGAEFEKINGKDGNYTLDHTVKMFAFDRYGMLAQSILPAAPAKAQHELLRRLLKQ